MGALLKEKLSAYIPQYSFIQEVRGRGLMIGVALDRPAGPLSALLMKQNMVTLTAGENVLRLLPPLTITEEDVNNAVEKIGKALKEFAESEEK